MYYGDYETMKAQRKALHKAFERGRLSEETYNLKVKELDSKLEEYEMQKDWEGLGFEPPTVKDGHYVINLDCPCDYAGTVTCDKMDFALLGKDRKGFIYFECPKCKQHLQYDPLTGKTRTRKGVLGFLFGRFS